MIVDDEAPTRTLLAVILTDAGFDAVEAADGEHALRRLAAGDIDVMLLDNRMPGASGLEVITEVRGRRETAALPILLVTGDIQVGERVRGLEAGANDYILKPFQPEELVARVRAQLRGQAAWAQAVESQLRERAAIATALTRISRVSAPEARAEALCAELRQLRDVSGVAIIVEAGQGLAVPMAVQDLDVWGMRSGHPLPRGVGQRLFRRAAQGPWVEQAEYSSGSTESVAMAPMYSGDRIVAVLALGIRQRHQWRGETAVNTALSAAIDFAAIAVGLLSPELGDGGDRRRRRALLEHVLLARAFKIVFQPIIDLREHKIVGYEALTRFSDGVAADVRFAEATSLNLGIELERATLASVINAAKRLPDDCWLSVNASPALVLEGETIRNVALSSPRHLVIELSEHDPVADYRELRKILDPLRPEVGLSVDDAGSGFASLRHVLSLEPTYMKLDQSWVTGVGDDPARQALIAGLSHFAETSGCQLIAEGIESDDDFESVRDLGVALGQGFLIGRPVPVGPAAA